MANQGIPRFSEREMARRHGALRALMEEQGLDAVLVFGHSGGRRHNQADIYYLTSVAPFHESYALFPREGDPVLWITHYNHLASAKAVSAIDDVRRASKQPAGQLVEEIGKRGLAAARVGLVGTFFYREMDALRDGLADATWHDIGLDFKMIRARKSAEELDFQRKAAMGCDAVMKAIAAEIRPGVEELDLLILSEDVAWKSGCEPHFLYLNSTPMGASESCVPNQNITRRKLAMGDVINTELTVSYGLYSAQILRPFFLGEPTRDYARLYEVLKSVHDRLVETIKPGVDVLDLYEVSGAIEEAGYTSVDSVLHGFGIDILPPNMRSKGFAPPASFTLERDMTLVVQPNPTSADERMGMQLGQTGLITDKGYVSMHKLPAEVTQCA